LIILNFFGATFGLAPIAPLATRLLPIKEKFTLVLRLVWD